jgi:predicted porin
MKLKTSAIALAVAGAMGASMAAQADSGFYGSIRIGLIYDDTKGNDEITVNGVASRFGFRGETDMGNGLTGFGRYEFGVSTEGSQNHAVYETDALGNLVPSGTQGKTQTGETSGSAISRRHAYVGLKGNFGEVKLGQTYHTFYSMITGPLDNPWRGSGFDATDTTNGTWLGYTSRTDQAITYTGNWGAIGFGATAYMDGSSISTSDKTSDLDGYELAVKGQAGPITLALGVQELGSNEGTGVGGGNPSSEPLIGLTASGWQTGIFTWGLGYTQRSNPSGVSGTQASWVFDVAIANGYVHYETFDNGQSGAANNAPNLITVGYTQSVGRQTTMYYEVYQWDKDTGVSNDDKTSVAAVLKYDWK